MSLNKSPRNIFIRVSVFIRQVVVTFTTYVVHKTTAKCKIIRVKEVVFPLVRLFILIRIMSIQYYK